MAGLDDEIRAVADGGDPLDLGIGTLFVADPEGHTIELVAADKGTFAGIPLARGAACVARAVLRPDDRAGVPRPLS